MLTHGYLASDRGYYHGGDITGLHDRLDYLESLGVTAIWVGPIYQNRTVQPDSSNLYGYSSGYHGYWPSPDNIDYSDLDSPSPRPQVESRISASGDFLRQNSANAVTDRSCALQ